MSYDFTDETLLTPSEVARLFRVDPKTVTRWATAGRIPSTPDGRPGSIRTVGGHRRFRGSAIKIMLDGQGEGEQ